MEFLRDPIWQFIGAILAVFTIYLSLRQQARKRLSYELIYNTNLLEINENIQNEVIVSYKGSSITNMSLIVLRLKNSGNIPITSKDFEEPIQFSFGREAKVFSFSSPSINPQKYLMLSHENNIDYVTLKPILINDGETIDLQFTVTQFSGKLVVEGKIIGVRRIDIVDRKFQSLDWWELFFSLAKSSSTLITFAFGLSLLLSGKFFVGMIFYFFGYFGFVDYTLPVLQVIPGIGKYFKEASVLRAFARSVITFLAALISYYILMYFDILPGVDSFMG